MRPFAAADRVDPATARAAGGATAVAGALVSREGGLGEPAPPADERVALAFLVRYPPPTRAVYSRALRHWAAWCAARELRPLEAQRGQVELWLREQETAGAAASTRIGRLAALTGFYDVAVDEQLLDRNPAAGVRRPRPDDVSQRLGVDRHEGAAILAAGEAAVDEAGIRADLELETRSRRDHLLTCLLLVNGLALSEALALDVEDLSTVRFDRVVRVRRQGGRHQDLALAPRTAAALDGYLEARGRPASGPLLVTWSGGRLDRWAAWKVIRGLARTARVEHLVFPHALRHDRAGLDNHSADVVATYLTSRVPAGTPGRNRTFAQGLGNLCSIH